MEFSLDNMELTLDNLTPALQVQLFELNVKWFLKSVMPFQYDSMTSELIRIS